MSNHTKSVTILKIVFWSLCVFSFAFSVYNEDWDIIGNSRKILYAIFVALFIISLACLLAKRFQTIAFTFLLILGLNTPLALWTDVDYVTLPPNLNQSVKIVGDVMPGFNGIETITTDEKGFRTTRKVDYTSDKKFRVFTIGGSTTEQIFLDDRETWQHLLQEQIQAAIGRPTEIINTGVSGLNSKQHFATLQRIKNYHPDLVIFMMGINDWNRDIKDRKSRIAFGEFSFRNTPLFHGLEAARNIAQGLISKRRTNSFEERGEYYSKQNDSLSRAQKVKMDFETVSDRYAGWVKKISAFCRDNDLRCIFVDQPNAYKSTISNELKKRLWMTPPNENYTLSLENMGQIAKTYNSWLMDFAKERPHLEACEIANNVPATLDYMYDDCHFNEAGSRYVSSLLADCILTKLRTPTRDFTVSLDAAKK